jgi:hypothetical protein
MGLMFPSVVALPPLPGSLPGRLKAQQNHRIENMTTTAAPMGQDSARAILGDGSNQ